MNEIANRLKTELSERSDRVRRLADKFFFLVKLDSIDVEKMEHLKTLKQQCQNFANDFETVRTHLSCTKKLLIALRFSEVETLRSSEALPKNAKDFLALLVELGWDVFPTLCIAYRLILTIDYSIASCERSFSKLKQIQTYCI